MLKHLGFSHSSDILGSDSPQSNNRSLTEGNSILATVAEIVTSYKIVERTYLRKYFFFRISNILATMACSAHFLHTEFLKSYEHFPELGDEIALSHRHVEKR